MSAVWTWADVWPGTRVVTLVLDAAEAEAVIEKARAEGQGDALPADDLRARRRQPDRPGVEADRPGDEGRQDRRGAGQGAGGAGRRLTAQAGFFDSVKTAQSR